MGAYDFITSGTGRGAEQAFVATRADASREFGHHGYTGTIAKKDDVLVADSPLTPDVAEEYAVHLLSTEDERIRQSGAADAIPVSDGTWLFVGYTASCSRPAAAANRPGFTSPESPLVIERKQDMKQTADSPCAPASFTPSLRAERYDELVKYDDAGTAKPPQRTYEKVWQGRCGPDFTIEDGEGNHRVRPVRLRIRWFQDGAAAPRWNSIEVTGHAVLPDESLDRRPAREIWTRYHASWARYPAGSSSSSAPPPGAADRPGELTHNTPSRRSLAAGAAVQVLSCEWGAQFYPYGPGQTVA